MRPKKTAVRTSSRRHRTRKSPTSRQRRRRPKPPATSRRNRPKRHRLPLMWRFALGHRSWIRPRHPPTHPSLRPKRRRRFESVEHQTAAAATGLRPPIRTQRSRRRQGQARTTPRCARRDAAVETRRIPHRSPPSTRQRQQNRALAHFLARPRLQASSRAWHRRSNRPWLHPPSRGAARSEQPRPGHDEAHDSRPEADECPNGRALGCGGIRRIARVGGAV